METLKQKERRLVRERKAVHLEMREIEQAQKAEKRELTKEELSKFESLDLKFRGLSNDIEMTRDELLENEGAIDLGEDSEGVNMRAYNKDERISKSEKKTALNVGGIVRALINGPSNEEEERALSEGTSSAGGYTVPIALLPEFVDLIRAKSRVIQSGAVTVPMTTNKVNMATLTGDVTAAWKDENAAVTPSDPTFGNVSFDAKTLVGLTKISRELFDDSINVDQMIQTSFAGAFGGEIDRTALLGTGVAPQPEGILVASGVPSYVNSTAISSYAPFLQALKTLRANGNDDPMNVIINPEDLLLFELLQDTTNQPMQPPASVGKLNMLHTSKITEGTALLGHFDQLAIGIRMSLTIEVLKETFAGNYQYGILGAMRADVNVLQKNAFCKITGLDAS